MSPSLRVASVPADHVYVRHLADPDRDDGVVRLPDPPAPGGSWWPPVMLEPGWVAGHASTFDVFHLHFGFDDRTPAQLRELVAALRAAGRPLVLTVHDLRNPHHAEPDRHDAALGVLVPAADAVLTLTPGAAAEIAARWGRTALVVPHPHVVDPVRAAAPRPHHDGYVIGLQAKARAGHAPVPVAHALADVVAGLPGARLVVDARDDDAGRAVAARLGARPGMTVRVRPALSDADLWDHLAGLDLAVLPYRFGTHSGWLEACHDLGTTVLAPDLGHFAEQAPCLTYRWTPDGPDRASLAAGVRAARARGDGPRADPAARAAQRVAVAAAHAAVYRRVLAERAA